LNRLILPAGETREECAVPYADVNDIRLYYEELGDSASPPLVLTHGGTGWDDLAPSLAATFRVLRIEHRGHGRTGSSAGTLDYPLLASDVRAFVRRLGLPPVHFAGVSDGGIVGLHLAIDSPELLRTLVCVGTNYRVDDRIRAFLADVAPDRIERDHPAWAADLARRHDAGRTPGYWRDLVRLVIENAAANPTFTTDDLSRIRTPTLLIAVEDDPFANLDQMVAMKRHIPGAEWLVINHAWHLPQHSHPEIVGPRLLDFLARHPG
jgi:pimeloyl-ACP methyl ester carboxylesterase